MRNNFLYSWVSLLLAIILIPTAHAYVQSSHESVWLPGNILLDLKLGEARFNTAAQDAMNAWNAQIQLVNFTSRTSSGGQEDYKNDLYFAADYEGGDLGDGVLAATFTYTYRNISQINQIFESDIVFNTDYTWELYNSAPVNGTPDFRRVAIHELGHVLGLTHPDENGQSVTAIMNAYISSVYALQADDIAGGQSLYRAPGNTSQPANNNFNSAFNISLSSGTTQVTGDNYYANKEAGEPDHDPGAGFGGQSVWWKWTAPGNGDVTIDTKNSTFDTLLGVYTGGFVSSLNTIGVNDDDDAHEPSGYQYRYSRVDFTATAGTTYYFAVDGWKDADEPSAIAESGLIKLNVTLSVPPPHFTDRPLSRLATVGDSLTISAPVSGEGPFSYQWKRNGQVIADATGNTLVINAVSLADAGHYEVAATGAGGISRSFFRLTVGLPNGAVVAWGDNQYGQVSVPAGLGGIAAVAAEWHSMALSINGTVASWGGLSSAVNIPIPDGLNHVVQIAAGNGFSLALKDDGTVVAWGDNYADRATVPAGLNEVVEISAGGSFAVALKADGTVVAWGNNSYNKTDVPPDLGQVSAIAAGGEHTLALKPDGTVAAWGYYGNGATTVPSGLTDVVAIKAGSGGFSLALRSDGTIVGWGQGNGAQVPAGMNNIKAISAGFFGMALGHDGSIATWGSASPLPPDSITNALAIAAGNAHVLAVIPAIAPTITTPPQNQTVTTGDTTTFSVSATGTGPFVYQWFRNGVPLADNSRITGAATATLTITDATAEDDGTYTIQVSNVSGTTPASGATLAVSAQPIIHARPPSRTGYLGQPAVFTINATGSGLTYVWRHNGQTIAGATGPTLDIPSTTSSDAGYYDVTVTNDTGGQNFSRFIFRTIPLNATLIGWGANNYGQSTPPGPLTNVRQISAGDTHGLALQQNGTVLGWGNNSSGQAAVPENLHDVTAVAAGGDFSLALKEDGTVVAWGNDSQGQATPPADLADVIAIAAGTLHALALKADGTVVAWGYNYENAATVPAGLDHVVAIDAKGAHSIALKDDGTVVQWGAGYLTWNKPDPLNDAVAIAAGQYFVVALRSDGTVSGWGTSGYGDYYPATPSGLSGITGIAAGYNHLVATKSDGSLAAWGNDSNGQASIPIGLAQTFAVSAGAGYNLALVPTEGLAISTQPESVTLSAGGTAILAVSAVGSGDLEYQWYRDDIPLENTAHTSGVRTSTLTISGVTAFEAGTYHVRIGDAGETISSITATLTVAPTGPAPLFNQRPLSRVALVGESLAITAEAVNATRYLWRHNGNPLPAATDNPVLTIERASLADNGLYEVMATNADGGLTWSVFHLTVAPTGGILSAYGGNYWGQSDVPANIESPVAVATGAQTSLVIKADGGLIAWGANGAGQTTVPEGLGGVVAVDAGTAFTLVLKNDGTVAAMGNLAPSLLPAAPLTEIVAIACGPDHYLALKADGTVVGWGNVSQATVPDGLDHVIAIAANRYRSMAVKADGSIVYWGDAYSPLADPPKGLAPAIAASISDNAGAIQLRDRSLVTWPQSASPQLGPVESFSVSGFSTIAIQADRTLVSISRTNGELSPVFPGESSVVSASAGSNHFLALFAPDAPSILTVPTSQSASLNDNVQFSVTANGSGPLTYQWRLDGNPLANNSHYSGADTSTLVIAGVTAADLGEYTVVVTDTNGSVTTGGPANLLLDVPVITKHPRSTVLISGGAVELSVTASSSSTVSYQWYQGQAGDTATPIAGETGTTLTVPAATMPAHYWVRATTGAGHADSDTALVLPMIRRTIGIDIGSITSISYAHDRYVALGSRNGAQSFDGITWTDGGFQSSIKSNVVYGNGLFVSGGGSTTNNIYHSTDALNWQWAHSAQGSSTVRATAFGDNLFLALGKALSTSSDAVNWTARANFSGLALIRGDGIWVAGSSSGIIRLSEDGLNWNAVQLSSELKVLALTYGNGRYVAFLGYERNEIWTSTDAVTWQPAVLPRMPDGSLLDSSAEGKYSLAYGAGMFVGTIGSNFLLSADGINWTVTPGLLPGPRESYSQSIAYDQQRFMYGGGTVVLQSPQIVNDGIAINSVAGSGIVTSGQSATLSVDASGVDLQYQWYLGESGDTSQPIAGATAATYQTSALTSESAFWVRVFGPGGAQNSSTFIVPIATIPVYSLQPRDTDALSGTNATLSVIASASPAPAYQWYAGESGDTSNPVSGANGLSYSVPAETSSRSYWVRASNQAGSTDSATAQVTPWFNRTAISGEYLGGVAYGNGRWVVSGFSNDDYYSDDDGVTWLRTSNQFGGQGPGEVVHAHGVFFATDSDTVGALWKSSDGIAWQKITIPGATIQFGWLANAAGVLFAMGPDGQFATSLDGITWTNRSIGATDTLTDACYGNGRFLLAAGRRVYRSTDLASWTAAPVVDVDTRIDKIAYGSLGFVGVGGANQGKILSSPDGVTWTERYVYESNGVYNVEYSASGYAVGASSHIILSADGMNWRLVPLYNSSQLASGDDSIMAVGWHAAWQSVSAPTALPVITLQPESHSVSAGASVNLTITATSDSSLTYQWAQNGIAITGATTATHIIPSLSQTETGVYTVTVTNSTGSITSNVAFVTIGVTAQTIIFPALSELGYSGVPITLSATASSGLTVSYTVLSGPATVNANKLTLTGTGTVTIRASQAGDATYAAADPVDRTFTVTANTSSWQADNFTPSELADESISGPTADPDGDGLTNLLEYALGLDPKDTNTSGLPEVGTTSSDWTYTYTRPADRPDLTYEVEYSTDLATWTAAGVTLTKTADNGSTQTWQATLPTSSSTNVFFRLKITQN